MYPILQILEQILTLASLQLYILFFLNNNIHFEIYNLYKYNSCINIRIQIKLNLL